MDSRSITHFMQFDLHLTLTLREEVLLFRVCNWLECTKEKFHFHENGHFRSRNAKRTQPSCRRDSVPFKWHEYLRQIHYSVHTLGKTV